MRTRSLKALTLIVCLLALPSVSALASGQPESGIVEARRLIDRGDFAKALELLTKIRAENPDLREQTQPLITEITNRELLFVQTFSEFTHALYDEKDPKKAADIFGKLHIIAPVPNAFQQGLLSTSQEGIRSISNEQQFTSLMDGTAKLFSEKKYGDAIGSYLLPIVNPDKAGFDLQKKEFEGVVPGGIDKTAAQRAISGMRIAALAAKDAEAEIRALPGAFSAFLAGKAPKAGDGVFVRMLSLLGDEARFEDSMRVGAASLQKMYEAMKDAPKGAESGRYLQYVAQLFLGRPGAAEGIARASGLLWQESADPAAAAAAASATKAYASAVAVFDSGDLGRASPAFDDASARSEIAIAMVAFVGGSITGADGRRFLVEYGQENIAEAKDYATLIGYRKDLGATMSVSPLDVGRLSGLSADQETRQLTAARQDLETRMKAADGRRRDWISRADSWAEKGKANAALSPLADAARKMADRFDSFVKKDLQGRDLEYALRLVSIGGRGFPARFDDLVAQKAAGNDLANGWVKGAAPANPDEVPKRPADAIVAFQKTQGGLDALAADVRAHEAKWQADRPYVAASSGLAALFRGADGKSGYDGLLVSLQREKGELARLSLSAQDQLAQAAQRSRDGDAVYTSADSAFRRNDFDSALLLLGDASDAYRESRFLAYDDHVASRLDTDIPAFKKRINDAVNAKTEADVTKLLDSVKQLYNNKDFLAASDKLEEAQRVWDVTRKGERFEPLEIWRGNIQTALQLSQGVQLLPYDPKADVVNSFISYARDNLAAGRIADAESAVNSALQLAPLYRVAKVLQLAIEKQKNAAGFEKEAADQIAMYIRMSKENSPESKKTAYLALLDYRALDVKFQKITDATILQLEYDLALKRRPPSAADQQKSAQLVKQADTEQQKGTQDAFTRALGLLNEALRLNIDNKDALSLQGKIRTKMGSQVLTRLSPADDAKLKQAWNQYFSGAYQSALDIVDELLQNARNATFDELIRLKKRCEAALGR